MIQHGITVYGNWFTATTLGASFKPKIVEGYLRLGDII